MSVRLTRLVLTILAAQLTLGSGGEAEVTPVIHKPDVMTEEKWSFLDPNFLMGPKPDATEASVSNSSAKVNVSFGPTANSTDETEAILQSGDKNKDDDGDNSLDDGKDGEETGDKDKDEKESSNDLWTVNTVVGCNIILVIPAVLLNGITMFHYRKQTTNLPSVLYFRNSLSDSVSAVGFLLQVPSVISVLKENTPDLLPLFSYWICTVAVRMSVFMNCVLGVVRCIKIVSPFYLVNRKMVTLSSLIYLLVWIAIASLDIWFYTSRITLKNRVYLIKSLILKTEPGFYLAYLPGSDGSRLSLLSQGEIVLVQFLLPVAVPALLCLFLMAIQIIHLKGKASVRQTNDPEPTATTVEARRSTNNDRAAITILMVTTIYVVTTILSVAVWLVVYKDHLDSWRGDKMKKLSWRELGAIYFSSSTLPLVCSTLTPLTLLIRGKILHPLLQEASRTIGWSRR